MWTMQAVLLLAGSFTLVVADLELVHLVFRHGQRTPDATYPKDPYAKYDFFPYGLGQLTNKGKQDQFDQGLFLRRRYDAFLGRIYSPKIMTVHSSDLDRTHMSAQLEMAGLWSPEKSQKWNNRFNWQPIAVHSQPIREDNMILVYLPCPRYTEEYARVLNSTEVQMILDKNGAAELYRDLSKHTGVNISSPDHINFLYSTLKAEAGLSLPLPTWAHSFYPKKLTPMTELSFQLLAYNKEMQKLMAGPLLKKILSDSKAKADGELKDKKLIVYSGHDVTVSRLLQALQVWDSQVPNYGIMVMIELHQRPQYKDHAIKIFLRNDTTHEPYPLTLPGCHHECPLDEFVALTQDVIPDDWAESCKGSSDNPDVESNYAQYERLLYNRES